MVERRDKIGGDIVKASLETFDQVARLVDPETGVSAVSFADGQGFTRRSFMKALAAAGIGLGLATIGKVPLANAAGCAASGELHNTIAGSCFNNNQYAAHCGPSTVYTDVCSGGAHLGWHKTTGNYRNRPNQCPPSTIYDGWNWYEANDPTCPPSCPSRIYRCHDGCKLVGSSWVNSICRDDSACFC